jgi:hypothetical protein
MTNLHMDINKTDKIRQQKHLMKLAPDPILRTEQRDNMNKTLAQGNKKIFISHRHRQH